MSAVRQRTPTDSGRLQHLELIEISSEGSNVPLQNRDGYNKWCTVPISFEKIYKGLYQFSVREDDVFVVSFPRSGTTWSLEATWLLVNNLNYKEAKNRHLGQRTIFMEQSGLSKNNKLDSIGSAKQLSSPRILKSHLPAHLIPRETWDKQAKIIYCARNPKDMALSYFHFSRGLGHWHGDLSAFMDYLISNDITYSPYWQHVIDFWQMRDEPNVCFITYEDMQRDLRTVLMKLNSFLKKPELSADDLEKLIEHLRFDNIKANGFVNPTHAIKFGKHHENVKEDFQFMRSGIVGSFKDVFTPEINEKLNDWTAKNLEEYKIQVEDIFGSF